VANLAEELFEKFMQKNKHNIKRMGFDEKGNKVPCFWSVAPFLRSLPDYVLTKRDYAIYFHVKGTNKLKLNDFLYARMFEDMFCQGQDRLYYVFCFKDSTPAFYKPGDLQAMMTNLTLEAFANDGNQYFSLPIAKGGDTEWISELKNTNKC
jgi:hypothetical protein